MYICIIIYTTHLAIPDTFGRQTCYFFHRGGLRKSPTKYLEIKMWICQLNFFAALDPSINHFSFLYDFNRTIFFRLLYPCVLSNFFCHSAINVNLHFLWTHSVIFLYLVDLNRHESARIWLVLTLIGLNRLESARIDSDSFG